MYDCKFHSLVGLFLPLLINALIILQILALFVNLIFLGQALTFMMVYVWSKRNPTARITFFGLMSFYAPVFPWVLFGFSILLGNGPLIDLMGICVGHAYYFAEDVLPSINGWRPLETPALM